MKNITIKRERKCRICKSSSQVQNIFELMSTPIADYYSIIKLDNETTARCPYHVETSLQGSIERVHVLARPLFHTYLLLSGSFVPHRNLLENGYLEKANKLLDRNWTIDGKVRKGRQIGKKIGFPTCNIDIKDYVLAKPGVYAVKVLRPNNSKYLRGIANLGYRPTFNQKKILLEVHLFNYSGNLYNKHLSVEFLKFIRKEKKFKNVNQLKAQIKTDLKIAKNTK